MSKLYFSLLVLVFMFCGCASTPELSSMQRRSIEAKDLEGSFDDAFKATLQVLQDKGYVIKSTDYQAGVIQGETGENQSGMSISNRAVTVTIEQFGEGRVKERITIVVKSGDGFWMEKESKIVDDPKILQEMYDVIQKEIFVRKNLLKK